MRKPTLCWNSWRRLVQVSRWNPARLKRLNREARWKPRLWLIQTFDETDTNSPSLRQEFCWLFCAVSLWHRACQNAEWYEKLCAK